MADFVLELADKLVGVGVQTSYGDAIDIEGTTILPVALGYYGFGGGSGSDAQNQQGSGGGGGGVSIPLGAYIGRAGGPARFEPNLIGLLLAATPLIWVSGKALKAVIRALKR